jgi:hypothetical protein
VVGEPSVVGAPGSWPGVGTGGSGFCGGAGRSCGAGAVCWGAGRGSCVAVRPEAPPAPNAGGAGELAGFRLHF